MDGGRRRLPLLGSSKEDSMDLQRLGSPRRGRDLDDRRLRRPSVIGKGLGTAVSSHAKPDLSAKV